MTLLVGHVACDVDCMAAGWFALCVLGLSSGALSGWLTQHGPVGRLLSLGPTVVCGLWAGLCLLTGDYLNLSVTLAGFSIGCLWSIRNVLWLVTTNHGQPVRSRALPLTTLPMGAGMSPARPRESFRESNDGLCHRPASPSSTEGAARRQCPSASSNPYPSGPLTQAVEPSR